MQDIFVSTLTKGIASWTKAFPDRILLKDISKLHTRLADASQQPLIFWLHTHDRLKWTELVAEIFKRYQFAKIVILDNNPNHEQSLQALSTGAMGYAHAYAAPELLTEVKAVISHGGIWLGQLLLQRLIETSVKLTGSSPEYVDALLSQLTKREKQVALEAAKGLSNKEIARILNITDRTVKAHLASTFERLHAKDRLQLALMLNKQPNAQPTQMVPALEPTVKVQSGKAAREKATKPAQKLKTAKLA